LVNGILNGLVNGMVNNMVNDMVNDVVNDMVNSMENSMGNDMVNGMVNSMVNDIVNSMENDMVNGMENGMENYMGNGITNDNNSTIFMFFHQQRTLSSPTLRGRFSFAPAATLSCLPWTAWKGFWPSRTAPPLRYSGNLRVQEPDQRQSEDGNCPWMRRSST
jgi:hypothetical protein